MGRDGRDSGYGSKGRCHISVRYVVLMDGWMEWGVDRKKEIDREGTLYISRMRSRISCYGR